MPRESRSGQGDFSDLQKISGIIPLPYPALKRFQAVHGDPE
jgi:hypothetical protein